MHLFFRPIPRPATRDLLTGTGPLRETADVTQSPSIPWWRDAVIYQVYLRSFADADGDGIGDLEGLRRRLAHLQRLGVDGLWINPCYPSPQADHGYDVADYMNIDRAYGDLAAFDRLLGEAHEKGLRVLMDLVPNHCSVEHPWFQAALASPPNSRERARFFFRDGQGADGESPPNDWPSVFGGSAWTRITEPDGRPGQWFLHLYAEQQPDLDWRHSDVGEHFDDVLRFWFDRGVDGFRIDVAHGLVKSEGLPDWPLPLHAAGPDGPPPMWNQPEVHEIHRRFRRIADSYARDLTLVGEIWVHDPIDLALYLRPDELPQAFYFDLLTQPWTAPALRASVQRGLDHIGSTGATITWTLANHDVHRAVTRYGQDQNLVKPTPEHPSEVTRLRGPVDLDQGNATARAALLFVLALPGSVYIYQGEELGLPEVMELPDEARQDPFFVRSHGATKGRDGSRVPLPWTSGGKSFGFSLVDTTTESWLPQPSWFADYAVATQIQDATSMLALYCRALSARKAMIDFAEPLEWIEVPDDADAFAFRRGSVTVVVTCGSRSLPLDREWGAVALASADLEAGALPPLACAWLTGGHVSRPTD